MIVINIAFVPDQANYIYEVEEAVTPGHVFGQSIDPGNTVKAGCLICLWVSIEPGTDLIEVPDVKGMDQDTATSTLEDEGFVVLVYQESSTTVAVGNVIRQNPGAGSMKPSGAAVAIYVSTGATTSTTNTYVPETLSTITGETVPTTENVTNDLTTTTTTASVYIVPNVVGMDADSALIEFTNAGFEPSFINVYDVVSLDGELGEVVEQFPAAGEERAYSDILVELSIVAYRYYDIKITDDGIIHIGTQGDDLSFGSSCALINNNGLSSGTGDDLVVEASIEGNKVYFEVVGRENYPEVTYIIETIYDPQYGGFYNESNPMYYYEPSYTWDYNSKGSYNAYYGPNCIEIFLYDEDWNLIGWRFSNVVYYYS